MDPVTNAPACDGVYHLKSLLWPGFHLFRTSADHFSLYLGYGSKYETGTFYPRFEYDIQEDLPEQGVQFEVAKPATSRVDAEMDNLDE